MITRSAISISVGSRLSGEHALNITARRNSSSGVDSGPSPGYGTTFARASFFDSSSA